MKKLLALMLAFAMVFAMAACTSSTEPAEPAETGETETAETTWPEKTIEIIIPYGAGGDTDFNARAFIPYLQDSLGVSVIGTNVTGSSGTVASRQVKDAEPDGYQVLFSHTVMNVNEMVGIADFGMQDFEIACIAASAAGDIITVNKSLGVNNLDELKAYAEAHPNELDCAINFGTMVNINGVQIQESGIPVNLVDVGGAADRVAALAGGHCDIIINAYGSVKDYLETGEFVALGTTAKERSEAFSDIPTCLEQGYEIQLDKHYFFAFPKGTDAAIVEKFAAAVKTATEDASYQNDIMTAYGQSPFYADPEEGLALMQETKDYIWTYEGKI